ncbi:hypothetical protein [Methanobrevibacter filiformis]|uniref:Uncharacterized protein n=1 Tax=Methanobrevibacter filiformis TaxID=55758 RepID=A0A166DG00_9EURY|nr:hypothetical protein [Methanobrevibacter filiformis]KZX15565.1 hypothetical protein MBFIL_06310 [Methanobrevibacter filiformis]
MIIINLIKMIKAKELIKEYEQTYGSIETLEYIFKKRGGTIKTKMDLENWKYFIKHPEEEIEDGKILINEDIKLGNMELELLNLIKNIDIKSVNTIAKLLNEDKSKIENKLMELEKEGLVSIEWSSNDLGIASVNYDKIMIEI